MTSFKFKDGILYFKAQDQCDLMSLIVVLREAFADRKFIPNTTPLYTDITPPLANGLELD
jgi:hypothetical protein